LRMSANGAKKPVMTDISDAVTDEVQGRASHSGRRTGAIKTYRQLNTSDNEQ